MAAAVSAEHNSTESTTSAWELFLHAMKMEKNEEGNRINPNNDFIA